MNMSSKYVPIGVLIISQAESDLPPNLWCSEKHKTWRKLNARGHGQEEEKEEEEKDSDGHSVLGHDARDALLASYPLRQFQSLHEEGWMELSFKVSSQDPTAGGFRVSLFPDDVKRAVVQGIGKPVRMARRSLIQSLDCSANAWNGDFSQSDRQKFVPFNLEDSYNGAGEMSLLQLFNTIPSPNPDISTVESPYLQEAMLNLLENRIPGLMTKLYAYQRRSAAVMLQKEAEAGFILDPRLMHLRDQAGQGWFYDSVTGEVLSKARHYDGVCGGILAEEMGAGKTIICLALVLATRKLPTPLPQLYGPGPPPVRAKVGSLLDMAASCATRNAAPWRPWFDAYGKHDGYEFERCIGALQRHRGYYVIPGADRRRSVRGQRNGEQGPSKVYMSAATIVVVPNNLLVQWTEEIKKHTVGLHVLFVEATKEGFLPPASELSEYDIILISQSKLERFVDGGKNKHCPLLSMHFKRCIVDEGHKLGTSGKGIRTNFLASLDAIKFSSRWVVTGTPARGLFGVDRLKQSETAGVELQNKHDPNETSAEFEKKDLERIGSLTAKFLKARPWANTAMEVGDTPADWATYLMLPKHSSRGHGRWDCLRNTLNSLIIRHRLDEVGDLLPPVDEKIVILEGSYQDRLSTNVFSMMITFNSVQSQRTDQDYFFHPSQRGSLMQLVHNLKQSTFFGASFFSADEIAKSVETAENFLRDNKVETSPEDKQSLREAIELGHVALGNKLRNISNRYHEVPITVEGLPGGAEKSWCLGDESDENNYTCAGLMHSLQRRIRAEAKHGIGQLNSFLNGGISMAGELEREAMLRPLQAQIISPAEKHQSKTLAGNTKLGADVHATPRSGKMKEPHIETIDPELLAGPLGSTILTATASSKMSYLLDAIIKHQDEEKIIVFYENDNVAWYLATVLEVVSRSKNMDQAQVTSLTLHSYKYSILSMPRASTAAGEPDTSTP